MTRSGALCLTALVLLSPACATRQGQRVRDITAPPAPVEVPDSWKLESPESLLEHRAAMVTACEWLLDVAPATAESKQWVKTRNFALDWIEASTAPKIEVVQPVVAYVATDPRFIYGAYMRGAYQCGKALWLLQQVDGTSAPLGKSYEAEQAGIDGMARLYAAIRRWDPHTRSRRLRRYQRKQRQGKLDGFLAKRIAKATR